MEGFPPIMLLGSATKRKGVWGEPPSNLESCAVSQRKNGSKLTFARQFTGQRTIDELLSRTKINKSRIQKNLAVTSDASKI